MRSVGLAALIITAVFGVGTVDGSGCRRCVFAGDCGTARVPCLPSDEHGIPNGGILGFNSIAPNVPAYWTLFGRALEPPSFGRLPLSGRLEVWSDYAVGPPSAPGLPERCDAAGETFPICFGERAAFSGVISNDRLTGLARYPDGAGCEFEAMIGRGFGDNEPNTYVCRSASGDVMSHGDLRHQPSFERLCSGSGCAGDPTRLPPLFNRKGEQGGGAGGVVQEEALDEKHSVLLLYINDAYQPDTHGLFVVARRSRRSVLTLGYLPSIAGDDTCRQILTARPGDIVVSTGRCDYGGDGRTRFTFDLDTGRVSSATISPPVLPDLSATELPPGPDVDTPVIPWEWRQLAPRALIDDRALLITPRGIYRDDTGDRVFELPRVSDENFARAGMDVKQLPDTTRVNTFLVRDGRIWLGLDVHGGMGIGGLGFYDARTTQAGLLRHPALVHRAVIDFHVGPEQITVVNEPRGEFIPSAFTDVALVQLRRDTLALREPTRDAPDWGPRDRDQIRRLGADRFMVERYGWEHQHARAQAGDDGERGP